MKKTYLTYLIKKYNKKYERKKEIKPKIFELFRIS
jgi:hypothetical protein